MRTIQQDEKDMALLLALADANLAFVDAALQRLQ